MVRLSAPGWMASCKPQHESTCKAGLEGWSIAGARVAGNMQKARSVQLELIWVAWLCQHEGGFFVVQRGMLA